MKCIFTLALTLPIAVAGVQYTASVFPGAHGTDCQNRSTTTHDYEDTTPARKSEWDALPFAFQKIDKCASWCAGLGNICKSFSIYWKNAVVEDYNEAHCNMCESNAWDDYADEPAFIWYGHPKQITESSTVHIDSDSLALANFNKQKVGAVDFWFGLATAAGHVEEEYVNDSWIHFARNFGGVASYKSSMAGPYPDNRLNFISDPDTEINLAANANAEVFRMGVEWGRLQPTRNGPINETALARYKVIAQKVKASGMKLMMTLFHHSVPMWQSDTGGWADDSSVENFLNMSKSVVLSLGTLVDMWCTFNEPHVFVMLSNCVGAWPPGRRNVGPLSQVNCLMFGDYQRGMTNIVKAHNDFYTWIHSSESPVQNQPPRIGVAHNVAVNQPANIIGWFVEGLNKAMVNMKFQFIDDIKGHLDWLGMNYYGREKIGATGPIIVNTEEYSASGRSIYPDGLFELLMEFNERYPQGSPDVKFTSYVISENGVASNEDIIRPSYFIEHLMAVQEAINHGVPVEGFVHWTISDNWEWADGYCPQFGLVAVDRSTLEFKRTPRQSYYLYKEIATTKKVTKQQRETAWNTIRNAALTNTTRPFCRGAGSATQGLDEPIQRVTSHKDWRFTQLSSADNGGKCYNTPWVPLSDGMTAFPNGTCVMQGSNVCPQAVILQREVRCGIESNTLSHQRQMRGVVCGLLPGAQEAAGCKKCCCSGGQCGETSHGTITQLTDSHCPVGLTVHPDCKDQLFIGGAHRELVVTPFLVLLLAAVAMLS